MEWRGKEEELWRGKWTGTAAGKVDGKVARMGYER